MTFHKRVQHNGYENTYMVVCDERKKILYLIKENKN